MPKLDAIEAALAGFRLIRRNPLSPAIWGLLTFVLTAGPLLIAMPQILTFLNEVVTAAKADAEPDMDRMMAMQFQWMALSPLLSLTALAARVLVTGATFRAVLEPSQSRLAFIRLGVGELLLAVASIVLGILVGCAAILGGVVVGVLAATASNISTGAAIAVGLLSGLALALALIWLVVRLSLVVPASFATRTLALGEAWRLSKGSVLPLILMAILVIVFVMLIETVIGGVAALILLGGLLGSGFSEATLEAFLAQPPETIIATLTPWVIGVGLIASLVGGYLLAIATAPWADAYRQLAASPASPEGEAAAAMAMAA